MAISPPTYNFETLFFTNVDGVVLMQTAYNSINTGIDNLQIRERLDSFFTQIYSSLNSITRVFFACMWNWILLKCTLDFLTVVPHAVMLPTLDLGTSSRQNTEVIKWWLGKSIQKASKKLPKSIYKWVFSYKLPTNFKFWDFYLLILNNYVCFSTKTFKFLHRSYNGNVFRTFGACIPLFSLTCSTRILTRSNKWIPFYSPNSGRRNQKIFCFKNSSFLAYLFILLRALVPDILHVHTRFELHPPFFCLHVRKTFWSSARPVMYLYSNFLDDDLW